MLCGSGAELCGEPGISTQPIFHIKDGKYLTIAVCGGGAKGSSRIGLQEYTLCWARRGQQHSRGSRTPS